LTEVAKSLFYSIVAENLKESLSDAPISGKLKISLQTKLYKGNFKKEFKEEPNPVIIKDIEIEFYEGCIETIKVIGEIQDSISKRDVRFENKFGIGFSTRRNYGRLQKIALLDAKFGSDYFIKLGDLLDYDYKVRPMTRDFSPANQVIISYGGQNIDLHKEETSKLFEAIVFSDFLGFDKDKPNGLIQIEVAKRINLNSLRHQTGTKLSYQGAGWFQFVRPTITISKIEENNRFLQPQTHDFTFKTTSGTDSLKQGIVTSPIQILYHQNLLLGLDLNILFHENSGLKYHFYLNGGFRFGRTAIRDSSRTLNAQNQIEKTGLVNEFGINYFTFFPEVILQFLPEERFSVLVSDRLQYFLPAFGEPELKTVNKDLKFDKKTSKWINSIEVLVSVKTGQNGKLFARWRFNNQLGNIRQNFNQVQLGYSFYILKKN
jgi:hypothetical protein